MTRLTELSNEALAELAEALNRELALQKANRLSLDLTRGKPDAEQLDLSNGLEEAIQGDYIASDGTDTRNYGQLRGIRRRAPWVRRSWRSPLKTSSAGATRAWR